MDHAANRVNWTSPEWVEEMLVVINWRPEPAKAPVARPKQLVASRATGRRGSVLWVSSTRVCLSYDDDDARARRQFNHESFARLYDIIN